MRKNKLQFKNGTQVSLEASLPVTLTTLAELNVIGLNHTLDVSELSYLQTQQILTLHALSEYMKDLGLEVPFHLDIKGVN